MPGQSLGLQYGLMLTDPLHLHNKIHLVAAPCCAVTAKAGPGVRLGVYLHAGGLIVMEGAFQPVVTVALQMVVLKNGVDRQALFDLLDFH